jgi:hypothetical protein
VCELQGQQKMLQDTHSTQAVEGQILHPGSRQLFSYWEKLRAERACPTREEFEFGPIKHEIPDMIVIDRDFLRNSFKYRLAGSRPCALFGRNLTGSDVMAGWGNFETDVITRHLNTALNQKQPAVIRMRLTTDRGHVVAAELIALPVQMRGSSRMQIIGGIFPFRAAQSLGHDTIVHQELASARVIWTEHLTAEPEVQVMPPPTSTGRNFTLIDGGKA